MTPCRLDPDFDCDGCEHQAIPECATARRLAERAEETPIGEQLDGMHEDVDSGQYDDDPNPYHGDYSEE